MIATKIDRLGFSFSHDYGSTKAIFQCTRCPQTIVVSAGNSSPGDIATAVKSKGWHASPTRKGDAMCPRCIGKKPKNDPDELLKKVIFNNPPQQFIDKSQHIESLKMPESPTVSQNSPSLASAAPLPQASADQRAAIRNLLDKHFDDSVGRYLDGMSDRAISEKVKVPAIIVKTIREAGWGVEKSDPEIEKLMKQVVDMEFAVEEIKKNLSSTKKSLENLLLKV